MWANAAIVSSWWKEQTADLVYGNKQAKTGADVSRVRHKLTL